MRCSLWLAMLFAFISVFTRPAQAREPAIPKDPDKFTTYMVGRFTDALPGVKVTAKGALDLEATLPRGPYQIRLDNIWSACERDRRQCRKQVDDFLANMPGVMNATGHDVEPADIRLIVRPAGYVDDMRKVAAGKPERAGIARPIVGDLWMICVADQPHGIQMLQHVDIVKLGLSEDQTIALGLKNLAAALPSLETETHVMKQSGLKFAAGDFYESSRLPLHDSWAAMSKSMGGHLVVAVPSNDFLIYGNGGGNGDRAVLSAFAETVIEKAPKPISATLLQWTPTGWEVVMP